MLRNYFKVALRNLLREKSYAFINVLGLAIGLTICLLVMAYITDEYSFDEFHTDNERIYRLIQLPSQENDRYYAGTPFPVRQMLLENVPAIEALAQFTSTEEVIVTVDGQSFRESVNFADPEFFQMFSFELLKGNARSALSSPNGIVLDESGAERIFGSVEVVGKELVITAAGNKYSYVVSAVAADAPKNSSIQYRLVLPVSEISKFLPFKLGWNLTCAETFLRLRVDADLSNVTDDIQSAANTVPKKAGSESEWKFDLQPLTDIHLNTSVEGDALTSSPTYSYLLGGIGFVVLILACINFTTLAIGRSQRRIREIGVRKVMGASETQLYGQLLSEAVIVSLTSLIFAFALAEIALPTFNNLSGKAISSILTTNGFSVIGIFVLVLLTALIAGGYPAYILTRTTTVKAVRGHADMLSGGVLTRVLVALQFTLSAALIVITLTMSSQLDYMTTAPLGFDREELVMLQLRGASGAEKLTIIDRLRNVLNESDGVVSVCASGTSFTGGGIRNGTPVGPDSIPFTVFLNAVDHEYLKTMGIELVRGRAFQPGEVKSRDEVIVNETFAKSLNWDDPIGKAIPGLDSSEIIGVVRDYHIQSLAEKIEPIALMRASIGGEWAGAVRFVFLRITPGNIPATMSRIEHVWQEVAPGLPFNYEFMNEHIEAQYRAYQRWETIMNNAALLAVTVACFGVFGLTALAIARRRKELGIRKVLGAKSSQLVSLLNREFVLLAIVGNLVAWPLAYYAANQWMAGFAYRIDFPVWPFVAGIVMLTGIVVATASVQAVRASLANPTEVIRTE